MKVKNCLVALCLALLLAGITSCGAKKQAENQEASKAPPVSETVSAPTTSQPAQLPVRYQSTGYVVANETAGDALGQKSEEYQIKVGATIRSTGGLMPLENILNRLANLKGMTVSWSSDVNQYAQVNVNIAADDNFFNAIDNLLRQVDFFHEVKGKTILVRNKDTKVYQLGVPAMKGDYTSSVGGNFLSARATSGSEGNVKIKSDANKFDVWENVESNLKILLAVIDEGAKFAADESAKIESDRETTAKNAILGEGNIANSNGYNQPKSGDANINDKKAVEGKKESTKGFKFSNRQTSRDGEYFIIDKSVGLITVTAKPVNLKRVDEYINRLKKELFRQISIEAKILEVLLSDSSKIGLDWSSVLKDFSVKATTSFGTAGQVYPHKPGTDEFASTFVSRVVIPSLDFTVMLNALNEQGDATVLANPKLTVLNGQPALISIGKDVAYVKKMSKTTDGTGSDATTTYTAEPDNVVQGIALGVMATILDDNRVNLHLTPITTDLENTNADGSIKLTSIGDGSIQLGLPQVRIRQMSTMVQVENGEMLIIGGLIDSAEGKKGAFAPGLGSIPVVKYLFGYEEKTMKKRELVILLTPKVL
jgi:general secretion pathway protein D/MSHA biogenesis protein MshL